MQHRKINTIDNCTRALKYSCVFIITLQSPMRTMVKICDLLVQKEIEVDSLQLTVQKSGDHKLILHCEIEKDRIAYMGRNFEKTHGVKAIDWMHSGTREKLYRAAKETDHKNQA